MGSVVGVTSSVAVGGCGVGEGQADGVASSCGVGEAASRMVGEADGRGCEKMLVAEAVAEGEVVLWQALVNTASVSSLATSLLVMPKNRLCVLLGRIAKRKRDWCDISGDQSILVCGRSSRAIIQDLPGAGSRIGRTDNSFLFHCFDQTGGAGVADP